MIFIPDLKKLRDMMLFSTDWTQAVDAPISADDKISWATYRQSLRTMFDGHDENDTAYYTSDNGYWPTAPRRFKCVNGNWNESLYTEATH